MTSSAIQDITGVSYAGSSKVQGKKSAFDAEDASVGSFQNAMNQAKESSRDDAAGKTADTKNTQSVSVQKTAGYEYRTDNTDTKAADSQKNVDSKASETKTEDTKAADDPKVKDAVDQKAEELEKEVVKEVADALDVSEEEVAAAMEALGLTFMDLLNQADMAALVTELTADGDNLAMLTDENLFSDIVELTDQITNLIQTGAEELTGELPVDFSDVMDMMTEAAVDLKTEVTEQPVIAEEITAPEVSEEKVTYEIENPTEEVPNASVKGEEAAAVSDRQNQNASQTSSEDNSESAFEDDHGMTEHVNAQPAVSANEPDMAPTVEAAAPESYTSQVDTQDIIDQIARHVRINNGPEFSEVEMSLHPASLGNVHLQVTANEGVITARIAAENEAVRDALLVQAMVLKEELSGQGLKIEAVEVTLASHEFEQNMQGESGENAEQLYEEQVKKETRRRIMISGLEEAEEMLADEDLTDAERIRIDMMAKSGSSMDMLA